MQNASYQSVRTSALSGYAEKAVNLSPSSKIDWNIILEVSPVLLCGFCWLVWLLFLVLPALSGVHGTGAYSAPQNDLYVGIGLVFCLTIREALKAGAGVRAVLFTSVLLILAYWF